MKQKVEASLYPDPENNQTLLHTLLQTLGSHPEVQQTYIFGSFARQQKDRWSDIDLLVVTEEREQFGAIYETLMVRKPVLYRSTFTPLAVPSGGRVLGIVFAGESVFHSLDLNFMTAAEFAAEDALKRFGVMEACTTAPAASSALPTSLLVEDFEPDDEKRIADSLHFVKKTLKRRLRGTGSDDELANWLLSLRASLQHNTPIADNPRGDIISVAQAYADMAAAWLRSRR
jgi:hypothetical protein